MKVLHVNTHFNIGGIPNYILSLSKAIKKEGVDTVVASSGGNLEYALGENSILHYNINIRTKFEFAPKVFCSVSALCDIIKKENVDIVHAHTRVSQIASIIAARLTGKKYITTCHGFFKTRLRKILDTWGELVIAISEPVLKHLRDDLDVRPERIRLVYSGVDTERFRTNLSVSELAKVRLELGLNDGPVIGTVGRLSPVKGQTYLIEAMKSVLTEFPNAKAVIIGDGPEGEELKRKAKAIGVDGSIIFAGSRPDTHRYLSVMDIFVFPSLKEGLGIALLEALAAGRCCIASNIGGIADIISDGENGLLVEPAKHEAIACAIKKLLKDPVLMSKMGQRGRALVADRFSIDEMARNTAKVYRELLMEKK